MSDGGSGLLVRRLPPRVHLSLAALGAVGQLALMAVASDAQLRPREPTALPVAASVEQPSAGRERALMRRFLLSGQRIPYYAEQTTRIIGARALESRQVVKHGGVMRERIEYLSPARLRGEVMLVNGDGLWHYRPLPEPRISHGIAHRDAVADMARDLLAAVRAKRVSVRLVGTEVVADRAAAVLELRGREAGPYKRIWLDEATGVRLRNEAFSSAGVMLSTSYFTRIDYSVRYSPGEFTPASLPSAPVDAAVPASPPLASVAEAQIGTSFSIREPSLPVRYSLKGVWVSGTGRKRSVILRYSDGVNALLLVQRHLADQASRRVGPPASTTPQRRWGVAYWVSDDMVYTLTGTVRPEIMRRIVESLR